MPGTRASARSPSATTARRRRRSALRPASRIRTAGTTRRSGSRSTARTQRRGSTPVPRRRSTRARTLRTRRSAGPAPTEPGTPVPPRRSRSPMTPRLRRWRRLPAGLPTRTAGTTMRCTVTFSGVDATSGIDSCTRATYSGPDNPVAFVGGSCRDRAGNQGTASIAVKYDGTAPAVLMLVPKPGKRTAELIWRTTPDAQSVELLRSPGLNGEAQSVVFRGAGSATSYLDTGLRPGREYQYRLGAVDQAANEGTKTLDFVARGALLFPGPGEQVAKPPLLVWSAVRGASYYNVVLVRSHRVYSAWPVRARLQLPRSWKYRGRKFKLSPGTYRWYVWPGRGSFRRALRQAARRELVRREALGGSGVNLLVAGVRWSFPGRTQGGRVPVRYVADSGRREGRAARPGGSAVLRQALPLTLVSDRPRRHGEEGRVAQDEEQEGEPAEEEKAIRLSRARRSSDEGEPGRRPDRVCERSDRGLHAVGGPGRGRWARVWLRPCAGGRPLLRRGGRRRSDDGTRGRRWGGRCGRRRRCG